LQFANRKLMIPDMKKHKWNASTEYCRVAEDSFKSLLAKWNTNCQINRNIDAIETFSKL
jgi:DNA polymerase II large subunit